MFKDFSQKYIKNIRTVNLEAPVVISIKFLLIKLMHNQGEVMRSPVVKSRDISQPPYNATMKNGHLETSKEKL